MTRIDLDGVDFKVVGEIRKLTLAPHDLLVVTYPGRLSDSALQHVKTTLETFLRIAGLTNKVLVMEQGATLSKVGAKDAEHARGAPLDMGAAHR